MRASRASSWRFTGGAIGGLLLALILVAAWSAGSMERAFGAFGDAEPSDAVLPAAARPPNDAAWEVHRLAAQVQGGGARPIGSAPWPGEGHASRVLEAEAQRAWSANYRYLWHALDPRDAPAAPDELHAWFQAHASTYDALVEVLLRDEGPDWGAERLSRDLSGAPGGAWRLQRHLLGRALDQAARGERTAAERTLLAAWRLEESFKRPRAAAWNADFNSGTVRLVRHVRPSDAAAWIARLDALTPRRDLDAHLRWAARRVVLAAEESQSSVPRWLPSGPREHLAALLDAPGRLRATRSIEALAAVSHELRRLPPCADPALELRAPAAAGIGSILADATMRPRAPGLEHDFSRLRQLEIDIALTRRVLALDAGIDEPRRPAAACADPPVTQSLGADGQWTVGWGTELQWPAAIALREVVHELMGERPAAPRAAPSFTFRPRVQAGSVAGGAPP